METDEYGYCHGLEKPVVEVLDEPELAAFEAAVRETTARSIVGNEADYRHRRGVEVLKAIHGARRDVQAYAALCEAERDLAPADCQTLAELCLQRRRPQDALGWVERGLALERSQRWPNRSAWRLPDLQREILRKLGRTEEALTSAWNDYQGAPSVHAYEDLMKFVPARERSAWQARAIAVLDGVDLGPRMDILVKTEELARLAADVDATPRARLVGLSHYTTEPAAACLERSRPLLAAKLHIAMALRILEAKKSRYYDAALRNVRAARKLMLEQGRERDWEMVAFEVRSAHGRKTGFMYGFDRIGRVGREPSSLDRARRRWRV